MILQALDDISSPAPVEAKTGMVYIPQARLFLPSMPDTAGTELKYQHNPARNESPEELMIVNSYGFNNARSVMMTANMDDAFKAVSGLQACARGYQLSFTQIAENPNPLKFIKKLKNNRSLYVYVDSDCLQTSEDFDSYLKQIDSY